VQRRSKNQQAGLQLRTALKSIMRSQQLTSSGWSKLAGVPESALRNFLAGRSNTLTHGTLMALAGSAKVPLAKFMNDPESWDLTETIDVRVAINATERLGEAIPVSDIGPFSVRILKDDRYGELDKFGAYVEDASTNALCPIRSTLICADFDWLTPKEEVDMAIEPGDFLVILEKRARFNKNHVRATYVRSTVRKVVKDEKIEYLISCSTRPQFIDTIRLPTPITGRTMGLATIETRYSDVIILGKVLTIIFTPENGGGKQGA
jgi:hypothetical protein